MEGRARIDQGHVVDGLTRLDETMLAGVGGELFPIMTGLMYCSVIDTCRQVYALGRAREWTQRTHEPSAESPGAAAVSSVTPARDHGGPFSEELLGCRACWSEGLSPGEPLSDNEEDRGHDSSPGVRQDQRPQAMWMRKLVRTILNYSPLGRDATEAAQQLLMTLTRQPHERDFLALRFFPSDALLLDVGANHGQSILSMLLVAPRATIVAFEPNVRLAEGIRNRWRRNGRVTVHAVGLSDRERVARLYVPSYRGMVYDGLASLDRREAVEWFNADVIYAFNPAHVSVAETTSTLRTLDSFTFPQPPYLIKIDAQGHEPAVLAGAAATIASARPVVLVEGAWRNPGTTEYLARNGYAQYEFRGSSQFVRTSDEGALTALNTFFITDDKRAEMLQRGAMFS